ncbi:TetR/AcrR family transcriptional regulator [Curtobacterium sp. ISL-83]|uniref:TetR/AcrR family transcriptional regulator n=1 Tax=Curtobacterium sp. ISL-83 TaxID=2819145 RepID=UPI001BE50BDC|nr:TetR/AcrR family transcriptional regulator [Curtobacterium sp. ISL-83]MBT2504280.1 TetR/AcrR family transcriptional regulator [Curtobacterium sp. ISL-83]
MTTTEAGITPRPRGIATRAKILSVAERLFTERGFEGTSIRDISEELGMTKSSLYHHFPNKDAILLALFGERGQELDELLAWVREQPKDDKLLQRAALRWIDQATPERLDRLRFARANQAELRRLSDGPETIQNGYGRLIDEILGAEASDEDRLYAQLAFDTISATLRLGDLQHSPADTVLAAARRATTALTRH